MIRIGIGSGNLCITRNVTGIGKPQLQAIWDCAIETNSKHFPATVADGGLVSSGDMVKALAAGANFLMMGSLFATAYESDNDGHISGMASRHHQEEHYHAVRSVEGITQQVSKHNYLKEMVEQWSWSIKSACTYVGAKNLSELRENARFIRSR